MIVDPFTAHATASLEANAFAHKGLLLVTNAGADWSQAVITDSAGTTISSVPLAPNSQIIVNVGAADVSTNKIFFSKSLANETTAAPAVYYNIIGNLV